MVVAKLRNNGARRIPQQCFMPLIVYLGDGGQGLITHNRTYHRMNFLGYFCAPINGVVYLQPSSFPRELNVPPVIRAPGAPPQGYL